MSGLLRALWALSVVLLLGGWDLWKSPNGEVERGNAAFKDGRYDDALEAYDKALQARPDDPGVRYNRGAALYQKAMNTPAGPARDQLLEQADAEFGKATQSPDPTLRSQAHYNQGNTRYQKGQYDKAVESYKQSIKEQPQNPDARHNLELALRKRKQEQQQQQQQQQQGQGQQGQGQGQQDPQQQQGQDPGQQDPQQQQGQDPGQQDPQQQGQDPGQQDPQQQQGQDPGQQDPQQGQDPNDPQQQGQGQDQKDPQQGQGQDQKDPQQGQDQKDPQDQQDPQQGQDPQDPGQQGGQPGDHDQDGPSNPSGKPSPDARPRYGDYEDKMDALERRSKDLKAKQNRSQGQRRRGPVKDW